MLRDTIELDPAVVELDRELIVVVCLRLRIREIATSTDGAYTFVPTRVDREDNALALDASRVAPQTGEERIGIDNRVCYEWPEELVEDVIIKITPGRKRKTGCCFDSQGIILLSCRVSIILPPAP
jgi:hypothetical protein